ncbi:MAG: sigma-70 family RNA polymerase sigma factor [Bacteroidota bacterium]|nr:sigma-70 family RNA polymerase sigma factor [Bacteroidota bacterium]
MKNLIALTDVELIRLFLSGDEKGFDVLFLRYKTDLTKVILYYCKDKFIAEDLVQDTFFKILSSLKNNRYHEEGKFLPWALRIAHNICMDHLRKNANTPPTTELFQGTVLYESTHSAETKMVQDQLRNKIHLLIDRLPDEQKEVVYGRHFEELSFKEISSRMNTSVNTSLGRMRYGLTHLRKLIVNDAGFVWQ